MLSRRLKETNGERVVTYVVEPGKRERVEKILSLFFLRYYERRMCMDILKRRGRPKNERPKDRVIRVRLDEKDVARLEYVRNKFGESSSDVLREGLRMRYNLAMFKE